MSGVLTGDAALIRRLRDLDDKLQRKIVKQAVGKAMTVISRGIKQQIPPKWKDIKKLIGQRFKRATRTSETQAKVGAAVGKKKGGGGEKIKLSSGKTLTLKKQRDKGRAGVGMGVENVHWFILGTKQRRTGTRRRGRGTRAKTVATGGSIRRTGRMPPQVPRLVARGFRASETAARKALFEGIRDGINREVAKLHAQISDAK